MTFKWLHHKILQTEQLASQQLTLVNVLPLKVIQSIDHNASQALDLIAVFNPDEKNLQRFLEYTWTLYNTKPHTYYLITLYVKKYYVAYHLQPFPTPYFDNSRSGQIYYPS